MYTDLAAAPPGNLVGAERFVPVVSTSCIDTYICISILYTLALSLFGSAIFAGTNRRMVLDQVAPFNL